jgi:hypothetical protein
MHYWPVQLALLAALLFFVGRLPALGSAEVALLAGVLMVATVHAAVVAVPPTRSALGAAAKRLLRLATPTDA